MLKVKTNHRNSILYHLNILDSESMQENEDE